jgi:hypothetical protein
MKRKKKKHKYNTGIKQRNMLPLKKQKGIETQIKGKKTIQKTEKP